MYNYLNFILICENSEHHPWLSPNIDMDLQPLILNLFYTQFITQSTVHFYFSAFQYSINNFILSALSWFHSLKMSNTENIKRY